MRLRVLAGILASVVFFGCSTLRRARVEHPDAPLRAELIAEGVFDCFAAGLTSEEGKAASCEISAVAYAGGELVIANDQTIPTVSPVAVVPWGGLPLTTVPRPVHAVPFAEVRKLEATTTTPDGAWVLASTGFDRVAADDSWNPFNTLLYWPAGQPEKARVAQPTRRDGRQSSIAIRWQLQKALADAEFPAGPPYFKVEGLAALPDGRLLFGIREIGDDYASFHYAVRILSVPYRLQRGELILGGEFRSLYDVDLSGRVAGFSAPMGISSLEYDRYHDRLLLLTSFETDSDDEGLGAFLWSLTLDRLDRGEPPVLVIGEDGAPFRVAHKAEGLAVIDRETIVLLYDDDKILGRELVADPSRPVRRRLEQAAWSVLAIR